MVALFQRHGILEHGRIGVNQCAVGGVGERVVPRLDVDARPDG